MNHIRRLLLRYRAAIVTAALAAVAVALTWALVWSEIRGERLTVNWAAFAVISTLLVACERTPSTWIRVGPAGVVTPMWMFAFGLMLVGSPSLAVSVALFGATVHSITQAETVSLIVFRVGGSAVSLSAAALMLTGMGVHGSITEFDDLPWDWAGAIVVAGITIVILNTAIAAISLAIRRRISFMALMQRGLGVRITSEGALLSLAPLWVIGIDFGLVMAPLLGITTILVFRSTRQALERSHEALHDGLTGLMNRRSFLDHLEVALHETHGSVIPTILVMDLDGFKDINDRLGHQLGDSLLIAFADQLHRSLPGESTAARLGGDEFAVLLTDMDDVDKVRTAITRLHGALLAPLRLEDFPVSIGVSMGVAMAPQDGHTPRDLLRSADVAMYKAKRAGSSLEFYENCVKGPQRGRLNLLSDLSDALRDHQLYIHFQPQLRMTDGEVDTLEALIRWDHPQHGSIPPSEFIGLAVNVSARSLQDPDFAPQVFAIMSETGFRADQLELEVTERSLVTNAERCRFTIERLRSAGVRIAIDDFGIGYSSFQALRTLEIDRVKIDREFVEGILAQPRDRVIVASVIDLAHDLGLDVVAEGVESTQLWDALCDLGCDVAQGFGIAVPMAYPELRGWLSSWNEILVEDMPTLPPRQGSEWSSHA